MLLKKSPLIRPPALFAMGAVAIILLIYRFGNIREVRMVQKLLDELRAGQFQDAYQTWGPTQGYTYRDFMADWRGNGYYGKIGDSRILKSKTEGSGVIVLVEFSHLKRPVALWVERRTRTLAFSPIETLP